MSTTTDVLRVVCQAVQANRGYLGQLDAALGDGDHGISMAKTFAAVERGLDALEDAPVGMTLSAVGTTIMTSVGGAMGPLFGTAFMSAGTSLTSPQVSGADVAIAVEAARDSVQRLGHANVGDKTMLDALDGAASLGRHAADAGADISSVVRAAADGAEAGAQATAAMQATLGRASRLGERSMGTPDPGATSVAIILRAAASALSAFGTPSTSETNSRSKEA